MGEGVFNYILNKLQESIRNILIQFVMDNVMIKVINCQYFKGILFK